MRQVAASALLASLFALAAGCAKHEFLAPPDEYLRKGWESSIVGTELIKVMTWNVYVGADVDVILGATDPADAARKVAVAYEQLKCTRFSERAKAIAMQVANHRPDLIGFQEISLIQRLNPATQAVEEETDYLQILLGALRKQNLRYRVAAMVQNADVTVPRLIGTENGDPALDFVRLRDSDVVLVGERATVLGGGSGRYAAVLPVPDLGIEIPRGYVSILARIGQREVRFLTTHLESAVEDVRLRQAQELATVLAGETLPTIVAGDFNTLDSEPPGPMCDKTYLALTREAGLADVWMMLPGSPEITGFTYPHESDLRNEVANLNERIDLILLKNCPERADGLWLNCRCAEVIGEEESDRTAAGTWPSDHAGVVATLGSRSGE